MHIYQTVYFLKYKGEAYTVELYEGHWTIDKVGRVDRENPLFRIEEWRARQFNSPTRAKQIFKLYLQSMTRVKQIVKEYLQSMNRFT